MPNESLCAKCEDMRDKFPERMNNWFCFCKQTINNKLIESVSNEYKNFKEQVEIDIESVEENTQLKLIMDDITESKVCPHSIDFA